MMDRRTCRIYGCVVPAALLLATVALPAPAHAQGLFELVAHGRALSRSYPDQAYRYFERALALDSLDYEANWRGAVAAVEWGKETPDSVKSAERDSLYATAVRMARRAVRVDSTQADGWFALSMALGRAALTKGQRDRLSDAVEIHDAAVRALTIAPDHDGAHHVLGLWNAEVMRISGFKRFMAKNILGAKVLGKAKWDSALVHLERAVALDPSRIYHRLDLARVYVDRKRYDDARTELRAIDSLPNQLPDDPRYRVEAAELKRRIVDKHDKPDR
jgi:tetratricopeptide (TPR) repeat protein